MGKFLKRFILVSAVFVLASASTLAQSAREGKSPGCKSGNLFQEGDPLLIKEMGHFLAELQIAVAKGNKTSVAHLVSYPLSFGNSDTQFTVHSEKEFLKKYDQILPVHLRDLVLKQEVSCISRVGAKGFTIGTGEIWFGRFQDGKIKIFTINAVAYPEK